MLKKLLLAISVLIVAFIFFLPSIVATKPVVEYVLRIYLKEKGTCTFKSISLSWLGPQKVQDFKFHNKNLELTFESLTTSDSLLHFLLTNKINDIFDNGTFFLKEGNIKLTESHVEISNLNVTLVKAKIDITGKTRENELAGSFSIKGFWDTNSYTIDARANNLPIAPIDRLLSYSDFKNFAPISSILGNDFSFALNGRLVNEEGPIDFSLDSKKGSISFKGILKKDGFSLTNSLNASLLFTPELHSYLAKNFKNFPYIVSQKPVTISIQPEGFYLPFKLSKTTIEKAILDPSILTMENRGPILLLMNFLKENSGQIDIWFTPIEFSLNNGILTFKRLDALIEYKFQLCLWGDADIVLEEVKMTLGLTAQALDAIFGIQGLSEDFVIPVPLKGSFKNIKVDTKLASSQIATLIASQHMQGSGNVIGGILGMAAKQGVSNKNIPPPKKPFPWEGRVKKSQSPSQRNSNLNNLFQFMP